MKLLRIKDNSQQKKDAFSQVARLTGKIADKTLEQLEREGVFVFPETVKDAEDMLSVLHKLQLVYSISDKQVAIQYSTAQRTAASGWFQPEAV